MKYRIGNGLVFMGSTGVLFSLVEMLHGAPFSFNTHLVTGTIIGLAFVVGFFSKN